MIYDKAWYRLSPAEVFADRRSALIRPFANKCLNRAIAWELSLLVAVLYLPFFAALGTLS